MKKKNKQIPQILFLLVIFVMFVFGMIFYRYVTNEFQNALDDSDLNTPQTDAMFETITTHHEALDTGVLLLLIMLTIMLLISSFFIPTHPVFLVINVVGLIVLVILAAAMANMYGQLIVEPGIAESLDNNGNPLYERTTFLMVKLPWICALIVLISTIVLYAKSKSGSIYG